MFSKKPQIIKFEQNLCHASVNDNSVLFVRVTDTVTDKNAMFEIPLTHVAYVIKGGGDGRMYKSGHYDVFDDKKEVKAWKKGFSVDIVYMPKDTYVLINWGTPDKVRYRDEASNKVINIGARGQFAISIVNHEQFFRKVVGVRKEFDLNDFKKRFSALVVNEFDACFLNVVKEQKLTYDQFDFERKTIGEQVGKLLSVKFEADWGVSICDFIIEWFAISDEDAAAIEDAAAEVQKQKKLKEYLAELERLDDKQWEREKYLRQLELQDKAAYYEVMKVVGSAGAAAQSAGGRGVSGGFCPNCGQSIQGGDLFCPKCGQRLVAPKTNCPKCGHQNDENASFCALCGTKLK